MTAVPKSSQWISPEEYLDGERLSDIRHEYIEGAVYAVPGASDDHNRIAGNIFGELWNHLRGGPCEVFQNDMKVKISPESSLCYYPDVLVVCDPSDNARYFRERPSIIFEVSSPETERIDRREKLLAYRDIATLQMYIIVEQDRQFATIYRRNGKEWGTEYIKGPSGNIHSAEINFRLALKRIYERTTVGKSQSSR
jgi:Uma2 family endonuclease